MKIAIDGPAGAGKSTIARIVAQKLGLRYLDTGAMYRAITWQALQKKIDLHDGKKLVDLIISLDLEIVFQAQTGANLVFVDGKEVTALIREPEISEQVSLVASHGQVRELIVGLQQQIAQQGSIVMEGRDIGTVVMPDAEWKIFLKASVGERAKRRQLELEKRGHHVSFPELEEQIRRRDLLDSTRLVSPLRKANDAIEVDTTALDIPGVVSKVLYLIQEGHGNVQGNCRHN